MATTTLVCKQCNYENEPERVYCHNCGAKLDRSLLPPEATKREDPVIVQDRVRKMVSPRRGMGLRSVKNFVYSVLTAAVLAAILVIFQPPDGVPDLSRDAVMSAPTVTDDMEDLLQEPAAHRLAYTEDQINAFLQSSIRGRNDASLGFISMKFEKVFVHFDEGVVRITSEQTLFDLPVYATTSHTVEVKNGTLVSKSVGGYFGRLPISPRIMPYLEGAFAPLWKVLDHDRSLVARMDSVTFHKKQVELVGKGSAGAH